MSLADFPEQRQAVDLLQRSLERGRLGHAYLFTGHQLGELEAVARALAKALICQQPVRRQPGGPAVDACDQCILCRKIDGDGHPDLHWVRPESKSRVITIEQMRELMREIHLKPNEAAYKVAIIVAADRLNVPAANAFLKTLEEPPAKSVMILLSTEPQRILETILSRCLRLNFAGEGVRALSVTHRQWLEDFSCLAASEKKSLMARYRLLGMLLKKLGEMRGDIEQALTARSPLQRHEDVEPGLRERWEDELNAAIEAEYRLQRAELLLSLQWWLRDIWVHTLGLGGELLSLPQLTGAQSLATGLSPRQAMDNLSILEHVQRLLGSNVQEALAIEVGLLKLNL